MKIVTKFLLPLSLLAITTTSQAAITLINGDFSDPADLLAVPNDGDTSVQAATNWQEIVGSAASSLVNKSGDVETRIIAIGRGIGQFIREESNTSTFYTFSIGDIVEVSFDADLVNDLATTSVDLQLFNSGSGGSTDANNVVINADGRYSTQIVLTVDATKQLRLRNGTNNDIDIDNISVQLVPEPSSSALLGLGGLALILRRRKQ